MRFATCIAFMLPLAAFARNSTTDSAAELPGALDRYKQGFYMASNALASMANQTAASNNTQELRVFHAIQDASSNIPFVDISLPLTNDTETAQSNNASLKYVDSLCAYTMVKNKLIPRFCSMQRDRGPH